MKYIFMIAVALVSFSSSGFALEAGCRLQPSQIETGAVGLQDRAAQDSRDMTDSMVIHTGLDFSAWNQVARPAQRATRGRPATGARLSSSGIAFGFNYEAYLRPSRDDFFALPGFPLLGARLSREHDVIYVCAHSNPQNHAEDHATIYFLHGKELGHESITAQIGNIFTARDLHVAPLQASLFAIGAAPEEISDLFGKIPLLNIVAGLPVAVLTTIQRTLGQSLALIGGAGVARITVTNTNVELASNVNLRQPRQARVLMNLPLQGQALGAR